MYMGTPSLLNFLLMVRKSCKVNDLESVNNAIHTELIGLRNRNREREKWSDGFEWHQDDYDRMWGKKVVDHMMSKREIEQFIEENRVRWYNPYNDGRDCTGVWFTTSIRCIPIQGKTFIYHFKSCDV